MARHRGAGRRPRVARPAHAPRLDRRGRGHRSARAATPPRPCSTSSRSGFRAGLGGEPATPRGAGPRVRSHGRRPAGAGRRRRGRDSGGRGSRGRSTRPARAAAEARSCSAPVSARWRPGVSTIATWSPRRSGTACRCAAPTATGSSRPTRGPRLWGDALSVTEGPARVALISQSGNVAVNALATRRGLRFHTVIASGNQAVLSAADYLEFLAGRGWRRGGRPVPGGRRRPAPARRPGRVRAGRTCRWSCSRSDILPAGARAAAAHSGALAGDQRVFRSLVQEAGAVWADDVHELLELAKTIAAVPVARAGARPPARRTGWRS